MKAVNITTKKSGQKKQNSKAPKVKKAPPTMSKKQKAPLKAKLRISSPVKGIRASLPEEVITSRVVSTNQASRTIRLPQHFI